MPKSRPDWVKCIRPAESRIALCGRICGPLEFTLTGYEHAISCIEAETYVQPCPDCLKIAAAHKLKQSIEEMTK